MFENPYVIRVGYKSVVKMRSGNLSISNVILEPQHLTSALEDQNKYRIHGERYSCLSSYALVRLLFLFELEQLLVAVH